MTWLHAVPQVGLGPRSERALIPSRSSGLIQKGAMNHYSFRHPCKFSWRRDNGGTRSWLWQNPRRSKHRPHCEAPGAPAIVPESVVADIPEVSPSAIAAAGAVVKDWGELLLSKRNPINLVECIVRYGLEVGLVLGGSFFLHRLLWRIAAKEAERRWICELKPIPPRPSCGKSFWWQALLLFARPLAMAFPLVGTIHAFRVAVNGLDVLGHNCHWVYGDSRDGVLHGAFHLMIDGLVGLDQGLLKISGAAGIALVVWLVLAMKQTLVQHLAQELGKSALGAPEEADLTRLLLPVSTLLSWVIIAGGLLSALNVLGIDVRPLLTLGSVSGAIIGLSAQSLFGNLISGLNLFLARTYVSGDRIAILNHIGKTTVRGVVERTDPLRTIIRLDNNIPVAIPNKSLVENAITNESKARRIGLVAGRASIRILSLSISISLPAPAASGDAGSAAASGQSFGALHDVLQQLRSHVQEASLSASRSRLLPTMNVASITKDGVDVELSAPFLTADSDAYSASCQQLMLDISELLQQAGCQFSVKAL